MSRISIATDVLLKDSLLACLVKNVVIPPAVKHAVSKSKSLLARVNLSGGRKNREKRLAGGGQIYCRGCGASIDAFADNFNCAGDLIVLDEESDPSKASKLATGPGSLGQQCSSVHLAKGTQSFGCSCSFEEPADSSALVPRRQLACIDGSAAVFQLPQTLNQLGEVKGGFILCGSGRLRFMDSKAKRKSLA